MLKNKVAVVTGGTRGIGYAVVEKFLKNGAKVVLFGSRQETVEKALAALKKNPDWEVSGAWPKLTDAKAVADEMAKIKEKYGRIDILVNNAGVSDSTPIGKYTAELFSDVMDLNVNAMMNGIIPVVEIMKGQGGGCILNTSSMVSVCGQRCGLSCQQICGERTYLVSCKGTGALPYPCECGGTGNHEDGYGSGTAERDDRAAGKPDSVTKDWGGGGYCECVFVSRQ